MVLNYQYSLTKDAQHFLGVKALAFFNKRKIINGMRHKRSWRPSDQMWNCHKGLSRSGSGEETQSNLPRSACGFGKRNPGLCRGRYEPGGLQSPSSTESSTCKDFGGTLVHLFSGDDPKFWMAHEKNGVVITCIELTKGADLRNSHLYGWLEQLAMSGKIDVLLAGSPCRSVSVCRLRSLEGDDGPQVARARQGQQRFGRKDLSEEELKLVCNDNLLWMRTLWLAIQAYEANQNLEITLE